ncbi:MAG TPA: glycoside hydrolase family 2 TIM barrel-domain containing protein [Capsulimonadaceae bacterium]
MTSHSFRKSIDLGGEWKFAYSDIPIKGVRSSADLIAAGLTAFPAIVPGNFELDLQRNGLIDEPLYGMNIAALTRYEHTHVWYWRTFTADAVDGMDVNYVFAGLDCFADVHINGHGRGYFSNMLTEHTIHCIKPVDPTNEILVHIRPAVDESRRPYPPSLFAQPQCYDSLFVRKAPHMYGWDIMPRALSAGIWRPVALEYKPVEHLERIAVDTLKLAGDHNRAHIAITYSASIKPKAGDIYYIRVEGTCGESVYSQEARALSGFGKVRLDIEQPKLWWPKGRGDANLYDLTVTLIKNGQAIDSLSLRHGIRTVKLEKTSITDAAGSGEFCFWVNGEKVFVLGTNWVPLDAYHSRDIDRLPAAMELVDDIGVNMIRCWGGNVYENDLFYDLCDQMGIMVWQDFAMACAFYPQDENFQRTLSNEATAVVRRLRNHPCVVLWAGDNECDEAVIWSGYSPDPNDNVLTRKVLPEVVRAESHGIPYLPSSPYIDSVAYNGGDLLPTPESHLWGPRNYYKSDFYTKFVCHFASEMGYHGCPSVDSLKKFLSPEKLWPYQDNEKWLLHCTSPIPGVDICDYRVELMATQIRALFGEVPDNLEDYVFASQAVQAEAFKFFIETFRSQKWRRTGIIWWNLLDGWPQLSDAVVDYYFDKKLAYDYIKTAQKPLHLIITEAHDGVHTLVAANDTRHGIALTFTVTDASTGGIVMEGCGSAAGDAATQVASFPVNGGEKAFYIIEWQAGDHSGRSHYLAGEPVFRLDDYKKWLAVLQRP